MARLFRRRLRRRFGRRHPKRRSGFRRRFIGKRKRTFRRRVGRKFRRSNLGHKVASGASGYKFHSRGVFEPGNYPESFVTNISEATSFGETTNTTVNPLSEYYPFSAILGGLQAPSDANRILVDPQNFRLFGAGDSAGAQGRQFYLWLQRLMGFNEGNTTGTINQKGRVCIDWMKIKFQATPRLYFDASKPELDATAGTFPSQLAGWWVDNWDVHNAALGSAVPQGYNLRERRAFARNGVFSTSVFWKNTLPKDQRWVYPPQFSNLIGANVGVWPGNKRFAYGCGRFINTWMDVMPGNTLSDRPGSLLTGADMTAAPSYVSQSFPMSLKSMAALGFPPSMMLRLPCLRLLIPGQITAHQDNILTPTLQVSVTFQVTAGFRGMRPSNGDLNSSTFKIAKFKLPAEISNSNTDATPDATPRGDAT